MTALALAVSPAVGVPRFPEVVAGTGGLGVALLALSLLAGWTSAIAWSLVLLAGEYAGALALRADSTVDAAAPLVAAGLLVTAELAYWSLELRGPGHDERRVLLRRATALLALTAGSLVLGAFVVVVTALPLGGGLLWDAVGVAAAAAALTVLAALARRDTAEP